MIYVVLIVLVLVYLTLCFPTYPVHGCGLMGYTYLVLGLWLYGCIYLVPGLWFYGLYLPHSRCLILWVTLHVLTLFQVSACMDRTYLIPGVWCVWFYGLYHDKRVQEVWGNHVGNKWCICLLEDDRHNIIAYVTLSL